MSRPRQQRESGSSLDNLSFDNDEYSTQDVRAVLPPSARARHGGAAVNPQQPTTTFTTPRERTSQLAVKPSPRASAPRRQDERDWYYGERTDTRGEAENGERRKAPSSAQAVASPPTTSGAENPFDMPGREVTAPLASGTPTNGAAVPFSHGDDGTSILTGWSSGAPVLDIPPHPQPEAMAAPPVAALDTPPLSPTIEAPTSNPAEGNKAEEEEEEEEHAPIATHEAVSFQQPAAGQSLEGAEPMPEETEQAHIAGPGEVAEDSLPPAEAEGEGTVEPQQQPEEPQPVSRSSSSPPPPPTDFVDPSHDAPQPVEATHPAVVVVEEAERGEPPAQPEAVPALVPVPESVPQPVADEEEQDRGKEKMPDDPGRVQPLPLLPADDSGGFLPHSAPLTPEHQYPLPDFDGPETGQVGVDPSDSTRSRLAATTEAHHPVLHFVGGGEEERTEPAHGEAFPLTQPAPYDGRDDADDATAKDEFTPADTTENTPFDSAHKSELHGEGEDNSPAPPAEPHQQSTTVYAGTREEGWGGENAAPLPVAGAPTPSGSSSIFLRSPLHSHSGWQTDARRFVADNGDAPMPVASAPEDTTTHNSSFSGESAQDDASFSLRSQPPPSVPFTATAQEVDGNTNREEAERREVAVPARTAATVHFAEHLNTVASSVHYSSSEATPATPPSFDAANASGRSSSDVEREERSTEVEEEDAEVVVRPLSRRHDQNGDSVASPRAAEGGEGGETISVRGEVPLRMSEDAMQEARLRVYNESCTVSTLDFLRETGDSVLPDAVANMFAATSSFLQGGKEAIAHSMPAPLRSAAKRTGRGIALFADFTGDIIANAPEYVMTIFPDSVVSQETKQLVAVDFLAVMRVTLDVNILAVPYVFRMAGLVGGLVILVAVHLLCYYNTVAFFAAKNQLKEAATVIMYGDVPRMTWGKWFPMISLWYGAAFLIAYVTYAASNLRVLLGAMGITGGQATALAFTMPSVFALPLVFMKRASTQRPLAAVASLLVFVSIVLFLTALPYETGGEGGTTELRLWASDVAEFFIAIGIAVYILCPLRTAVPVERSMAPRRFLLLLRVTMSVAFCCHLIFGLCVFTALRTDTCSVLAVSLPNGPVETAAAAILFFAFLCIIPLAQFPIGELCDRRVLGVRTLPTYWQLGPNLMRILFLVGAVVVAYVLPYYGLLVGLGGAFGCGIIGLVVPAALDYVRRERARLRHGHHLRWWEYVMVFSNLLFGAVCVVLLGIIFAFYQIWVVMQAGHKATC